MPPGCLKRCAALCACLMLVPHLAQGEPSNCSDLVEYGLKPDNRCCYERRAYVELRTYTWKFFMGLAVVPWTLFPNRGGMLSSGLQHVQYGGCIALGVAFSTILECSLAIVAALPLWGLMESATVLSEPTLSIALADLRASISFVLTFSLEERRAWPWKRALTHAYLLVKAVEERVGFPQLVRDLTWLSRRLGTDTVPVPPATRLEKWQFVGNIPMVVLKAWQQQEALRDCLAVLERAKVQHFPTGGTLVGLVRYGELQGQLSGGKVDVVDRDMDWMVRAESLDAWFLLAKKISDALIARGWLRCELLPSLTEVNVWAGQKQRMKCIRHLPYLAVADFEAYSVDGESLQTGFCECEYGMAMVDARQEPGCLCSGKAYSLENVLPLQSCRVHKASVPCPRRPAAYLAEVFEIKRCLALPTLTEGRAPNDERNLRLLEEGLNASDVHLLRRAAAKLNKSGYASFLADFADCSQNLFARTPRQFLALLRGWSRRAGNDIRLYLVDSAGADDVSNCSAICDDACAFQGSGQRFLQEVRAMRQELLFRWTPATPLGGQVEVDNYEALAVIPPAAFGYSSEEELGGVAVLLVNDNNDNPRQIGTQLVLLRLAFQVPSEPVSGLLPQLETGLWLLAAAAGLLLLALVYYVRRRSARHVRFQEHLQLFARCFPETYPFGYGKCCRDPGGRWYKDHMDARFEKRLVVTSALLGPRLRGLPFASDSAPAAPVEFDLPVAGRLSLRTSSEADASEPSGSFWPAGWIFARLAEDLQVAVRDGQEYGWEAGAQLLQPLLRGELRVLDVSCGFGLSSIAAARAGHNVTATEMSRHMLQIAGRNAQRNSAKLRLLRWELLGDAPTPSTLGDQRHAPAGYAFDLCLVDITWAGARFRQLQHGSIPEEELAPTVQDILTDALRWLSRRGGCRLHAFIGHTAVHGATASGEESLDSYAFDNYTAELVRGLEEFGAAFRRGSGPRVPTVSPLGWLEKVGWTPPIWYRLILW
ncbi:unnamed protein product [Symbiodinium natans]|uniref:Uncharacterized protein n=1 Tax=Symbiodinium natans TaxID=878477 RepID=A0A812SYX5_9DINO|nr:unnamed protein product [Symbiodinium natans]